MKKVFLIILITILSNSCVGLKYNMRTEYLNLSIFQTIDENSALAFDKNYNVVKIITAEDVYYDGKSIKGYFVLVDTYTYETIQHRIKTVPVFVKSKEFNKIYNRP